MQPEDNKIIAVVVVVAILFIGGYTALVVSTGSSMPFSMVSSESMQHDNARSQIGCIDTGDVVVTVSPEKRNICSYIEGTQNGYSSFGDYGSVIIYQHWKNDNPVIHRAILWIDYDETDGKWKAPSLQGYEGEWRCNGTGCNDLGTVLEFEDLTISKKDVEIHLNKLEKKSGYLTLGDNPQTNRSFDQEVGDGGQYLVSEDKIRSVAIHELPWLGTIRILLKDVKANLEGGENLIVETVKELFLNDSLGEDSKLLGSKLNKVPNSLPSIAMVFVLMFAVLLFVDLISVKKDNKNMKKELEMRRRR